MQRSKDKLRVLIVSQYFPPETGGPQSRIKSIVQGFTAAGVDINVITQKPNYPTGVVWDGYREGVFLDRDYAGVPVTHCWVYEDRKKTFFSRIAFYLSFMVMSVMAALRTNGRFDAVFATSPPLFVGLSGWLISRLKRAKYVFDVRDIWPDVAIAMGELRNRHAIRAAKAMEKFIYKRAHGLTAVTRSFCRDIARIVGDETPVELVTNGTVCDTFALGRSKSELRAELDLPHERQVVSYVGNLGLAQGLKHVTRAAQILSEQASDALFVFVGEGSVKEQLVEQANYTGLMNIVFRPRVDEHEAAKYMAASDALLVPLADNDIYKKFIPSKLFDSMASSRPVLLSVNGEARLILQEAGAGLYYPPEDSQRLAEHVLWLGEHYSEGEEMGKRGTAYVRQHFTREEQARRLVDFVHKIVSIE